LQHWGHPAVVACGETLTNQVALFPSLRTPAALPSVSIHRLQAIGEYQKQNSGTLARELVEAVAIP